MEPGVARTMWHLFEPYHALIYFAPEARDLYARAGLKGGWMGYFASRAAAMGPVPSNVVVATFYNFHPRMVERAIPDAWSFCSPEGVVKARYEAADAALRRLLGSSIDDAAVVEAAELARRTAEACDPVGRALHAAHASLPWPEAPHLALWHAATLLREHRGDGHVATLVAHDIDGCESHVLVVARGASTAEMQREFRGWSVAQWDGAVERLRLRGLVDERGAFTPEGRSFRERIEETTDELASPPYEVLGEDGRARLTAALGRVLETMEAEERVPYPNPMGLPRN